MLLVGPDSVGRIQSDPELQEQLAAEDPAIVDSQRRHQESFYGDLRKSAHHLALVALVTRFQHWIGGFVRQLKLRLAGERQKPVLVRQLEVLNRHLGVEQVLR